jgi:hypothetical protein
MAARFRCLTAFDQFNHRLRSGEVVPFQAKESCGTPYDGHWYCVTCEEMIAEPIVWAVHMNRGDKQHVMVWRCDKHEQAEARECPSA